MRFDSCVRELGAHVFCDGEAEPRPLWGMGGCRPAAGVVHGPFFVAAPPPEEDAGGLQTAHASSPWLGPPL